MHTSCVMIPHRDGSSGYSFTKYKKDSSEDNQEFVDEWIPFDRPPSSFAEEHIFRAKQVCQFNMIVRNFLYIDTAGAATKGNNNWIRFYPRSQ